MTVAQPARIEAPEGEAGRLDVTPSLGYTGFAILLLMAIYFGAWCCGTCPRDLAVMTVWP